MSDSSGTEPVGNNDELLFADEETSKIDKHAPPKWKVMIVDDEEEVHDVTKMVLSDVTFNETGLMFLHAYSADETKNLIKKHPDTALILLDVVMEEDDSGLKIIKYIREELKNNFVRIVIRTGQPGEAPEKKVIVDYDINDYKEKTELTSQKLFSTVIASLRSYENLITIDNNRRGLEKIIEASVKLFEPQSLEKFSKDALHNLLSLFRINENIFEEHISGFIAEKSRKGYHVMAFIGEFENFSHTKSREIITDDITKLINKTRKNKKLFCFDENQYIDILKSRTGDEIVIYFKSKKPFNQSERYLTEILGSNITSIFENICLTKEIEETQKELLITLGEVVESRSRETGKHVERVAEYSKHLALHYGISEEEADLIKRASPMHDIGKVGIPDSILNKPEKLTIAEFEIIKTHTTIGYEILKLSKRKLLKAAAIIALQHHERYDGKGYPAGLKGEEIHIYGRITCLADVFDALGSDRVYKEAWSLDQILTYIKDERGKHFDPVLVDIFFDTLDDILGIRDNHPDTKD
jgi:response regulator RpfG family c-di-GMP phosphodiesterase